MLSMLARTVDYFQSTSFYEDYANTFEILHADNLTRLCHAQALYERHYGTDFMRARNVYDFLLLHKETQMFVGAGRLTLPRRHLGDHVFDTTTTDRQDITEISRLIMSERFLSRPDDGVILPAYYAPDGIRRKIPYAPIGLIGALLEASLLHGYNETVWQIDAQQMGVLSALGMSYQCLARSTDSKGVEQFSVLINIHNALDSMEINNPPCWDVLTRKGEMYHLLESLSDAI